MYNLIKHHAVEKWDLIHLAGKRQYFFSSIFQSPDGMCIASAAICGIFNIHDISSGKLVNTLVGIIWSAACRL
jgi:hypothetical protein